MPIPPKPKDFVNGAVGDAGDNADDTVVTHEVLAHTLQQDDTLTVVISSGAPFFSVLDFWVGELRLEHDPEGPGGKTLTFWDETRVAGFDSGVALPVQKGQRVHVEIGLHVPKNVLTAGIIEGAVSVRGAKTDIVVSLHGTYTPSAPPSPPPGGGVGPGPVAGGNGGGGAAGTPVNCGQLQADLANTQRQLVQFQQQLKNTGGPEGPGTPRDQIEKAIAALQDEISAIEATIQENGCNELPTGGPRFLTFDSPVYGTVALSGAILDKWVACSSLKTGSGQNVQEFLGMPVRPTQFIRQTNRQVDVQEFEHGAIFDVEGTASPAVVYGPIYARYHQLGSLDSFLGAPTSDEVDAIAGRMSVFEDGQIVFDPVTSVTHEVHGAILLRWTQLNGPAGPLGMPTTDEMPVIDHTGEIGRYQMFMGPKNTGAAIYFSQATGASEIMAPIYFTFLTQHGGPSGDLGFPTGAQETNAAGTIFHSFQKGIIVAPAGLTPVTVTSGLNLRLFRYIVDDDFNVQINITASTGQQNVGRMPADGQFDAGSQTFGPDTILTVSAVDHGSDGTFLPSDEVIHIHMEAISERVIGEDDRKGTIDLTYSIDNAWGLTEAVHTHQNGAFTAEFAFQPNDTPIIADTVNFREQAFWPFKNFDTNPLSWAQYEKTFRDVVETDKHIDLNPLHLNVHLFEILFYETVYRSLAQGGNCFGMCLESVYARTARSLFIEPIFSSNGYVNDRYVTSGDELDVSKPNSTEVGDEINVKHGYQLGADFIHWFLDKWTAGALHDPVRAFRESRDAHQRGDWPIFTISNENEFSQDGHCVTPYAWNGDTSPILPGQRWEILCANPNFAPGKVPDNNDDHCKIFIRPFEQQFEFHMSDDASGRQIFWTGSSTDGGRLLAVPFSMLSSQPVTLGDEIMALLATGIVIILADNGHTTQFTDEQGRTLFQTPGSQVVNSNISARIPNLMPVPHRQATFGGVVPELYFWRRDDGPLRGIAASNTNGMELHHDIQGSDNAHYRYIMRAHSTLTSFTADRGSPGGHRVSLHNLGAAAQKLVIHSSADQAAPLTTFNVQTAGWQTSRTAPIWFEFQAAIGGNQQLHFHAGNGGTQLSVHSPNVDARLDIRMLTRLSDPAADPIVASRSQVVLPAGQVVRFEPSSWRPETLSSTSVRRAVIPAFGSSQVLDITTI